MEFGKGGKYIVGEEWKGLVLVSLRKQRSRYIYQLDHPTLQPLRRPRFSAKPLDRVGRQERPAGMRDDDDVGVGVDEFGDDGAQVRDVVKHGRVAGGGGAGAEELGGLRGEAGGVDEGGNLVKGGGADPEAGDEEDSGGHCGGGEMGSWRGLFGELGVDTW